MKSYDKMNSSNTALIVIDIINSCVHEKCESPEWNIHFSKIRDTVPKLNDFIKEFKSKIGGLVIFTNTVPWQKKYLPENINELYTDPAAYYYSNDTSGFPEQFYLVSPENNDVAITKNSYDAFTNPQLEEVLKENNIQYLVMTGVFTEGCVLATVHGGFARGYNFIILKDLVETADDTERQDLQKILLHRQFPLMFGKTITSQEFLDSWS